MRMNNYKFKQDFGNFLISYTPDRLFFSLSDFLCIGSSRAGFNATNLYKQRGLRWYRSGSIRVINNFISIFVMDASNKKRNIIIRLLQNIHYRLVQLWAIVILLWILLFAFGIVIFFRNDPWSWESWKEILILKAILYGITILYLLICKFKFRKRKDLIFDIKTIIIFPFFIIYSLILRIVGFIGTVTFYIPFIANIKVFKSYILNMKKEFENIKQDIPLEDIRVNNDVQEIVNDLVNKVTEPNQDLEIVEVNMNEMVEIVIE